MFLNEQRIYCSVLNAQAGYFFFNWNSMAPIQEILSVEKTSSSTTLRKIILKLPRYLFVVVDTRLIQGPLTTVSLTVHLL